MKLEKLSTKDWMSQRLRLVNATSQPKSKQLVLASCYNCLINKQLVFAELIRSVNNQSKHVEYYHCPKCYRALPSVKLAASESSKSVLSKITAGASERSKKLWSDNNYRNKKLADSKRLSADPSFASKISESIKKKFVTDPEYVAKVTAARRNNSAEFFAKCAAIHDNLYDYSSSVYKTIDTPIMIKCQQHGEFSQLPNNHIRGHGCPACAIERSKLTNSEFLNRCNIIHNNRYDYSATVYESSLDYITYKCRIHGDITQLAQNHLKGSGCRFCDAMKTSSRGELELAQFVQSIRPCERNNRSILSGNEIDILVGNIGIEYHGIYWHSYNRSETKEESYRHYNKLEAAIAKGLSLIQIYESEWIEKPQIVKSMLRSKLGIVSRRLYARKCNVYSPSEAEAFNFFNNNHLHGHRKSSRYLALTYDDCMVAAVSFNYLNGRWELMRFCNILDTVVVGGLSRLIRHSGLNNIFTYVDRRYSSNANSYKLAGFINVGTTVPGYCYCKGCKLFPRQMFQKHKLSTLLANFDPNRTEAENMFANGYRRLWDAGHYKMKFGE